VPLHVYKRPGGGGEDCSDRPVIARLTDEVPVLTDEVPVDPPCGSRLTRATMMLATAATTAASSTCHRSRPRPRLFLDRDAMDQILASRPHTRVMIWTGDGSANRAGPSAWFLPSGPLG
jgi:hypothetical protein